MARPATALDEDNRASSRTLGWSPADFGAERFDEGLRKAVAEWQAQHFIPATGVVDPVTWRAVVDRREGLEDASIRQPREDTLAELCSVSRYAEGHSAVARSAAFCGVSVRVGKAAELANLEPAHRAALATVQVPAAELAAAEAYGLPTLPGVLVVHAVGAVASHADEVASAFATADAVLASRANVVGVVLELDDAGWAQVVHDCARFTTAAAVFATVLPGTPIASAAALRANALALHERQAWRTLGGVDACLPPVPGAWPNGAVEAALGQSLSNWSIFAHLRPCFAFPVYHATEATDATQLHRFRLWLASRGARGYGLSGSTAKHHLEALLGPMPDSVPRID